MSLFMTNEVEKQFDFAQVGFDIEKTAEKVIVAVLDMESCPFEVEVNLLITDDKAIQEMNQIHRGIDKATDILSFPMIIYVVPGDFSKVEELGASAFHPASGELLLGDIVISWEKMLAQTEEYGHSLKREFAFLIAHSMLHLCGYDHVEEEERFQMEEKQRQVLEKVQILRNS
ncbi:MAG: rRNA maturation RNase YbeY [Lachnospiraceae bacterium]|nr:rRNA maturation RNase YbeY [Lachnospiraceae bacterium]